jgi:hypothetical protein
LRPGITVGFISGSVWLVYNLVNNLGDLSGGQNAALSVAGLGVTVSLFTLAGFRGSARTGRVRTGALTGLWAALVSSTVGITTLWVITLAAMDTIRRTASWSQTICRAACRTWARLSFMTPSAAAP